MASFKSLVYMRNKSGPITDSWGTPNFTTAKLE